MSRTNNLRKLVKSMLSAAKFKADHGIKEIYYELADDDKMYPHIVFSFDNINTGDLYRHDLSLMIDIYDKSDSAFLVEEIADDVEDMFNAANLPQDSILPTFYLEARRQVIDEDKKIRHRQIEVIVQNYEMLEEVNMDGLQDINSAELYDVLSRKLATKEVVLND